MTVYDKLAAIAEPIVQFYKTDLTKHDRAALDKMQPGDVAFWAPRECGTQFVLCSASDEPEALRWNRDWLIASNRTFPGLDWYMIAGKTVVRCTVSEARDYFEERIAACSRTPRSICGSDLWP